MPKQSIIDFANSLGVKVEYTKLQKGDLYIAERNTGPHLLEVAYIKDGYVVATTLAYPYDIGECYKVIEG